MFTVNAVIITNNDGNLVQSSITAAFGSYYVSHLTSRYDQILYIPVAARMKKLRQQSVVSEDRGTDYRGEKRFVSLRASERTR